MRSIHYFVAISLDGFIAREDGDVGWTFLAAVEGSASWVEEAWKATLTAEEAAALQAEALDLDPGDLFSLDFGFLIYQTSVYEAGREWLDARIETEGVAAIDDALVNGAASSEAVLRPLGLTLRDDSGR